ILIDKRILYLIFLILFLFEIFINRFQLKNIKKHLNMLFIFAISLIITFIIYKNSEVNGSSFVNDSSYFFRNKIIKIFPNANLLNTIPGLEDHFISSTGKPPVLTNTSIVKINYKPGARLYLRSKIEKTENLVEEGNLNSDLTYNRIKITVLTDYMPVLLTTNNTNGSDKYLIKDINATLKLDKPLLKNSYYYLYLNNIKDDFSESEHKANSLNSERIKLLAKSLKGESDLDTIKKIRSYLLSNYEYSLDVEESKNYIEDFLFTTKKGFCIHFTRAFIELALCNDIYVREVSGYLIDIPDYSENNLRPTGEYFVTGKNSHLWPEVKINNKWITFEVTKSIYKDENSSQSDVNDYELLPNIKENFEPVKNRYLIHFNFLFISIIIILVLVIIYGFMNRNFLKLIIKKGLKKGISHPKYTGWDKWLIEAKIESIPRVIILKHIYLNDILDKNTKVKVINNLNQLPNISTIRDKSSLEK
ncbi:MAG: transglutaminase domain-containing protein, partial [Spirochaetales bacterium]|nr:transglutaminase domain-containing protein [Spirochaetales bacterium]